MTKKRILIIMTALMLTFSSQVMAQAFGGKGSKQLLIGLGLNQHRGLFAQNGQGIKGSYSPFAGGLNVQMEFGIHDYVGLGFFTGFESFSNLRGGTFNPAYYGYGYYGSSSYWGMALPIGFHANFHFLQLIADKTGKSFADKLDVYAGLSIGSGVMFIFPKQHLKDDYPAGTKLSDVGPMIFGGGHVGIRYYPFDKLGFFAEVGYGKSLVQGGISLKL